MQVKQDRNLEILWEPSCEEYYQVYFSKIPNIYKPVKKENKCHYSLSK